MLSARTLGPHWTFSSQCPNPSSSSTKQPPKHMQLRLYPDEISALRVRSQHSKRPSTAWMWPHVLQPPHGDPLTSPETSYLHVLATLRALSLLQPMFQL